MTALFLILLCVPSPNRLDSNTLYLPRTSKSEGQILCDHGCAKEWDDWNYNGDHQRQDIRYSHRTHVGVNWCSTHLTKMERCSTRSWRYWRMMSFPVDSTQRSQTISTIKSDGLTILCGPAPKAFGDLPYGLDIVRFRFKSLFCSGKTLLKVYELWKAIFDRNFHVLGEPAATKSGTTERLESFTEATKIFIWRLYKKWVRQQRRSLDASTYGPGAYSERRCRSSCPNLL